MDSYQKLSPDPGQSLRRANDVIASIEHGWLKLRIFRVLPPAEAAEAYRLLESRLNW
jgi:hypothetical protein